MAATGSSSSSSRPPFPEAGSTIGPSGRFFCLGRLGKGTFCSIHKCVDLASSHALEDDRDRGAIIAGGGGDGGGDGDDSSMEEGEIVPPQRIVAAKAELADFVDSGVIDGEASVLRFLDAALPGGMVPLYVDHVREAGGAAGGEGDGSGSAGDGRVTSAIIMEYLPGEDMHLLRDRHCAALAEDGEKSNRRVSVEDAVYLVTDVVLPLLKAMHEVGMVHRDVKPSNVVRTGTTASERSFKIVDFGLSKSFVVPSDSSFADKNRPWKGPWMSPGTSPAGTAATGCVRAERDSAEFRGTSMYASLRVHQGRDHCPRDDIWGLLYVFCDLVAGGLPWMSYASARDRASCQIIKEMVVGERGRDDWTGAAVDGEKLPEGMAARPDPNKAPRNGEDATEWLLYGAEYHTARYRRDVKARAGADPASLPPLPEPLALSRNDDCIDCLRSAFRHVKGLGFVEMPDYKLIEVCLRQFAREAKTTIREIVRPINWNVTPAGGSGKRRKVSASSSSVLETGGVAWDLLDEAADVLDDGVLIEAENDRRSALEAAASQDEAGRSGGNKDSGGPQAAPAVDPGASLTGEAADLARLPLTMQFALCQAEYNASRPKSVPVHLALRDWMKLALPLAHGTWNAAAWERGNHRTDDDGYRQEVYMMMLQRCLSAAEPFDNFSDRRCFYQPEEETEEGEIRKPKRRRVGTQTSSSGETNGGGGEGRRDAVVCESSLVVLSRVFFSLRLALDIQGAKSFAPPPALSFR